MEVKRIEDLKEGDRLVWYSLGAYANRYRIFGVVRKIKGKLRFIMVDCDSECKTSSDFIVNVKLNPKWDTEIGSYLLYSGKNGEIKLRTPPKGESMREWCCPIFYSESEAYFETHDYC